MENLGAWRVMKSLVRIVIWALPLVLLAGCATNPFDAEINRLTDNTNSYFNLDP